MLIIYMILYSFIARAVLCDDSSNETNLTKFEYCSHPDCSMKNQHTMCVAANKHSPKLYVYGMTNWMRYQILLLHNRHRDNIAMGLEAGQPPATNMRKMYWDYELEQMAELWARQCQKRHDECRNTIRFNVLQNMDVRLVVPKVTEAQLLADVVGAWYSGSRVLPPEHVWSFRPGNCSAPGGCNAHWYTAAAWASTWRIGCSQALCAARKRSCAAFRKRRAQTQCDYSTNVTIAPSVTENILRRAKYMTSTPDKLQNVEDYATTNRQAYKESPLHRGLMNSKRTENKKDSHIIAFTFCNYGPAGNVDGFPIYEAGATCSNCPLGTQCGDRTHRALCSVLNDPDARPTTSKR